MAVVVDSWFSSPILFCSYCDFIRVCVCAFIQFEVTVCALCAWFIRFCFGMRFVYKQSKAPRHRVNGDDAAAIAHRIVFQFQKLQANKVIATARSVGGEKAHTTQRFHPCCICLFVFAFSRVCICVNHCKTRNAPYSISAPWLKAYTGLPE